MKNRKYKIFPHKYLKGFNYSLYIDANIFLKKNPYELFTKYLSNKDDLMACPKHLDRDCVYDEGVACIFFGKANKSEVDKLFNRYREIGFPEKFGLVGNNIIFRKHNSSMVISIMDEWWELLNAGPKRDQLSLMFLSWKNNFPIVKMDEASRNNSGYFEHYLHLKHSNKSILKKFIYKINANRNKNFFYKVLFFFKELVK